MEQLDDLLAGADVTLADEILDQIDEIVPPGTDVGTLDMAYAPPALRRPDLRRRPAAAWPHPRRPGRFSRRPGREEAGGRGGGVPPPVTPAPRPAAASPCLRSSIRPFPAQLIVTITKNLFTSRLTTWHLVFKAGGCIAAYRRSMGEPAASTNEFAALDETGISKFQLKIMFVSGMGFFTDAYDLFVIGIVVALLKTQWHLSTNQVSWLNSATLLASAAGALIFGRVADMLGPKKIFRYEVLILAIGAIASAFSPNYTFLLICRIILGIGIGGDYPVSATIMSEYSGKQSRGRMVGVVFAMQGLGLLVGALIRSIFLASGVSNNLTWRLL